MVKVRSASIEALRFIFMLVICLWHFGRINPFVHGYIAVDFYFLLSGYLLYTSYVRHKYDPLKFTIQKLKRLYPEYILVFFIAFVMKLDLLLRDSDGITVFLNAISESLLIHSVGLFSGGVNPPSWYLSVLIVGGALLYAIIYWNKKIAATIIFPLFVLLAYTYLLGLNGSLECWETQGAVSQCLMRGMAGMAMGIELAIFRDRYSDLLNNKHLIFDISCLFAVLIVCIVLFSVQHYDRFAILAFSVLIMSCFLPSALINRLLSGSLFRKCGGITYEMLLVHSPIIWVLNKLTRSIPLSQSGIVVLAITYIALVIVCSFCLKFIGEKINQTIK